MEKLIARSNNKSLLSDRALSALSEYHDESSGYTTVPEADDIGVKGRGFIGMPVLEQSGVGELPVAPEREKGFLLFGGQYFPLMLALK